MPSNVGLPLPADQTPIVHMTMPHYSHEVALGAARAFFFPTNGRVRLSAHTDVASSATPHGFNGLLAIALDARDAGHCTHMAMIHSDIGAQSGWLDDLWGVMWEHDAIAVSAVVPIKEPINPNDPGALRTSTAWGTIGKEWADPRYVRMGDRNAYPPTFGNEFAREGEELLINTGCMLLDLRWPHWDEFAFTFSNRIERVDGQRYNQFRPEDWDMSRYLRDRGARYVATWRVALTHYGWGQWDNH